MKITAFKRLRKVLVVGAGALMLAGAASAAIQQHTFTITGNGGETGSGSVTWDDTVVANGEFIAQSPGSLGNLLSVNFTVSGGNVAGGTATFTAADCQGAFVGQAPDVTSGITFWCNTSGANSISAFGPFLATLVTAGPSSTLTFVSGATSPVAPAVVQPVPTLSEWAMLLTAGLMALGTFVVMRRRG